MDGLRIHFLHVRSGMPDVVGLHLNLPLVFSTLEEVADATSRSASRPASPRRPLPIGPRAVTGRTAVDALPPGHWRGHLVGVKFF